MPAENERDACVRKARTYAKAAELAGGDPVYRAALAGLSSAFSLLAMVVPDPVPEGLSDLLLTRIADHRNRENFST